MLIEHDALRHHWYVVAEAADLGPTESPRPLGVTVLGADYVVWRGPAGALVAAPDRCPHRGGPLSQGIVFGERVACPLHSTCVELESGCAVAPDKGRVPSFPVKVDAGVVYVDLEAHADAHG